MYLKDHKLSFFLNKIKALLYYTPFPCKITKYQISQWFLVVLKLSLISNFEGFNNKYPNSWQSLNYC